MQTFAFVLILIGAVIASQPIARIIRVVPLPIIQILIGAALAWPVTGGVHVELEPEVFLLVFIPPLLFSDAWQAPKREFWQLRVPITLMAFGLVFFTILTFGYALHWMIPAVPLAVAFAAAAVLSPTDAVAVSSIVDKERLPPSMLHLLEGESLLNDASGLVMFRFATAAAMTGVFSLAQASSAFILAVVLGTAAGFAALWICGKASKILSKLDSGAAESQVLVILFLPFLAYLLAELWHASGVLAAVVAGMYAGRLGLFRHLSVSARILSNGSWQMFGFALNGAIFVFLGLQLPAIIRAVPLELSNRHWLLQPLLIVLAMTFCLMALRFVFLLGSNELSRFIQWFGGPRSRALSMRQIVVASVAGVRGAVTLAGVLSLPLLLPDGTAFPARNLVIFSARGVILCWLLLATLILPVLTRGLESDGHEAAKLEERRARAAMAAAAIFRLEQESVSASEHVPMTERQTIALSMIEGYKRRLLTIEMGDAPDHESNIARRTEKTLRQQAGDAEIECLRSMLRSGDINDHTFHKLAAQVTLGQAVLSSRGAPA